jgi:hypothetical protein
MCRADVQHLASDFGCIGGYQQDKPNCEASPVWWINEAEESIDDLDICMVQLGDVPLFNWEVRRIFDISEQFLQLVALLD